MQPRLIEKAFLKAVDGFPVVILTGARQTGKTTLCRNLLGKTHRMVSLEDPDFQRQALDDPRSFLERHPPPLIVGGIQYAPDLPKHLQAVVDRDRYWHGQFILTGSQSFRLMERVDQSLAGKTSWLTLHPASVEEVDGPEAPPRSSFESIADWILRGGYPDLREKPELEPRSWCANYLRLFLERDVRRLMNVEDLDAFERFMRLVAAQTATILNLSDLAREAGVSQPTAKRWLSILEASGLIFLLRPFEAKVSKRLVKSPKLYMVDTALASYLMGIRDPSGLRQSPFFAPLFETAAVSEHLKHRGTASLRFFSSHDGLKVDLLIQDGERIEVRNIQTSKTPQDESLSGLLKMEKLLQRPLAKTLLAPVSEDHKLGPEGATVVRPWHRVR